jgi:hypothetical protein
MASSATSPRPTILVLAAPSTAASVAEALRARLALDVETAPHRRGGLACLRRQNFSLVLLDEGLAAEDSQATDLLYRSAAATPLLEINFALASADRTVRQVRSALARRDYDRAQARAAASLELQNELSAALAGLLLESQLALREASPAQEPKLRRVVELAAQLRDRLRLSDQAEPSPLL